MFILDSGLNLVPSDPTLGIWFAKIVAFTIIEIVIFTRIYLKLDFVVRIDWVLGLLTLVWGDMFQ